ncbi:MAG TPA: DUF418 domain-containing protein, partial [Parafilimonas sp.]|nr:DUF418 domain-containing protein [Parafilimonas sp.]
ANYIFFRKSALLLSVLFGYGFAVLINNLKQKGVNTVSFFTRRMFWLFVIAFINSCFFDGDILKSYAVLGILLLLFYKSSTKTILVFAIILLALVPLISGYTLYAASMAPVEKIDKLRPLLLSHHLTDVLKYNLAASYILQSSWTFYAIFVQHVMFCCFLWGMFIQRTHFVENLQANKVYIKRLFWFSIPAFALSTYLTYLSKQVNFLKVYCNFFIIAFLCAMIFFSTAIMWLYVSGKLKAIFKAMELYGKMTLTNYIMQNIIAFFVFTGVGLSVGSSKPYSFYFILAVIVFVVQIFISKYWLHKFNYGPIEYAWRRLSSQKTLPFKKIVI